MGQRHSEILVLVVKDPAVKDPVDLTNAPNEMPLLQDFLWSMSFVVSGISAINP